MKNNNNDKAIIKAFQPFLDDFELYPEKILKLEYKKALEFFIALYNSGQYELFEKLFIVMHEHYNIKFVKDLESTAAEITLQNIERFEKELEKNK